MLPDRRWTFRIVTAALLVAVGWWVLDEETHEPVTADPEEGEQRPDYFMEEFTLTATGDGGKQRYRLESPHMEHFRGRDEWLVDTPRVTYFADSGKPWRLHAERGRAWNRVEDVHLQGEVTIRRDAGAEHPPANVDTSEVFLKPDQRYAETDEHAVYWRDGVRMEGRGLQAWLDREELDLLSEVQGRYAVPE